MNKPIYNKKTNKWEIWDFSYEEKGEKFYTHYEWYNSEDAIEFWKTHSTKEQRKRNDRKKKVKKGII